MPLRIYWLSARQKRKNDRGVGLGVKFDDFVNAIGDIDDAEELKAVSVPVAVPLPAPETPLDLPEEPQTYEIELTEETLAVADKMGLSRDFIKRFHKFITTDFGNDAKASTEKLRSFWKNEKLDDKAYVLMSDFVYAKGLQKFVRGYTDFICGKVSTFQRNMLIRAPHGFLKQELAHYMLWLSGIYRADFAQIPKDKWVISQSQAPALSVLDIQFLKDGLHDKSGADTGGCNLRDIYNSPVLCVYLCGDTRVDSEIVHEIYTYRSTHLQNALSTFVVISSLHLELYNSDRFFGDMWKEMVINTEGIYSDDDAFDARLHKLYCYFKSNRDVLTPIGVGSSVQAELIKNLF